MGGLGERKTARWVTPAASASRAPELGDAAPEGWRVVSKRERGKSTLAHYCPVHAAAATQ